MTSLIDDLETSLAPALSAAGASLPLAAISPWPVPSTIAPASAADPTPATNRTPRCFLKLRIERSESRIGDSPVCRVVGAARRQTRAARSTDRPRTQRLYARPLYLLCCTRDGAPP